MSAQPPTAVSPAGSVSGWSFKTWLAKNKGRLKWTVTLLFAYLSTLIPGIPSLQLQALLAAVVALTSAFVLDYIDFWLSDVPVDPRDGSGG